jgi:hypothetical protein
MRGVNGAGLEQRRLYVSSWATAIRDTVIVVTVCSMVSLALSVVRKDGIPLVQKEEYPILVPCPETTGEVAQVSGDTPLLQDPYVFLIDARSAVEFGKWHMARAVNIPFDYLAPTPRESINRIASSGAQKVLVYGDGNDPDSGEQLARELSGKGIRNMHFVSGGAPVLLAVEHRGATP